ncbi:GNAT family N-acetyltransferase [Hymenobacter busanensis]|uniref:GNAT family N-acetyltransferase n=1 Tax=Hymenobacter busanensis TaxID=2607656 RepID=A0A7L4ZYI6_9BACT|nr:GNAT family N-acetyltransferase [Hymenobacter busanensis]KAA9332995.1 GNAT family N-acetyltransferase [Hymenobacter busanensis]QHJ08331.1 GNAT family N-acetyltransferase [Hymenobacter busanensis]
MLSIRRATVADLPAILGIIRRVVPVMNAAGNFQWEGDYPNEAVFRQDIERNQLWVAELEDGQLAGVAALTTDQDPEYAQADWDATAPAVVTHRLAVDPAAQGRGVAAALLQQAEVLAREWNLHLLRVDTNSENQATQRLFPKLGYRFAGEIGLGFRPGLRFFCYEKQLPLEPTTS